MEISHRDTLPPDVLHELDSYTAKLNGFAYAEHNQDGSHSDVTADSISLQGARVGEFVDLPYDAARFTQTGAGTWTVDAIDIGHLRFCRIGQLVYLQFRLVDTIIGGTAAPSLHISLPELQMHPQQDQDGFNLQMAGLIELEDATGSTHGYASISTAAVGGVSTSVILQPWNGAAEGQRNFAIGGLSVMGSLMFMVNVNNAVQAFG